MLTWVLFTLDYNSVRSFAPFLNASSFQHLIVPTGAARNVTFSFWSHFTADTVNAGVVLEKCLADPSEADLFALLGDMCMLRNIPRGCKVELPESLWKRFAGTTFSVLYERFSLNLSSVIIALCEGAYIDEEFVHFLLQQAVCDMLVKTVMMPVMNICQIIPVHFDTTIAKDSFWANTLNGDMYNPFDAARDVFAKLQEKVSVSYKDMQYYITAFTNNTTHWSVAIACKSARMVLLLNSATHFWFTMQASDNAVSVEETDAVAGPPATGDSPNMRNDREKKVVRVVGSVNTYTRPITRSASGHVRGHNTDTGPAADSATQLAVDNVGSRKRNARIRRLGIRKRKKRGKRRRGSQRKIPACARMRRKTVRLAYADAGALLLHGACLPKQASADMMFVDVPVHDMTAKRGRSHRLTADALRHLRPPRVRVPRNEDDPDIVEVYNSNQQLLCIVLYVTERNGEDPRVRAEQVALHCDCADMPVMQPLVFLSAGGEDGTGGAMPDHDLVVCKQKDGGKCTAVRVITDASAIKQISERRTTTVPGRRYWQTSPLDENLYMNNPKENKECEEKERMRLAYHQTWYYDVLATCVEQIYIPIRSKRDRDAVDDDYMHACCVVRDFFTGNNARSFLVKLQEKKKTSKVMMSQKAFMCAIKTDNMKLPDSIRPRVDMHCSSFFYNKEDSKSQSKFLSAYVLKYTKGHLGQEWYLDSWCADHVAGTVALRPNTLSTEVLNGAWWDAARSWNDREERKQNLDDTLTDSFEGSIYFEAYKDWYDANIPPPPNTDASAVESNTNKNWTDMADDI
eukprot:g119.t1